METSTKYRLLTDNNPGGYLTPNESELAVYVAHLHLFAPNMSPLEYIRTMVDKTAPEGWECRNSVSSATAVGTIL